MKITHKGKLTTQILSVVLCALVLVMLACTMCPYFTIVEVYQPDITPNPKTDHFSLTDVMWLRTNEIIKDYEENKGLDFKINYYIMDLVLSFIFGLGVLVTSVWFAANEYRRFPSLVSGIFTHICGLACGVFGLMGCINNVLLDQGVPKFMFIRTVLIILLAVITLVSIARFVVWLLTELKLYKEKKARLALL